jgi:hypothetical protein
MESPGIEPETRRWEASPYPPKLQHDDVLFEYIYLSFRNKKLKLFWAIWSYAIVSYFIHDYKPNMKKKQQFYKKGRNCRVASVRCHETALWLSN